MPHLKLFGWKANAYIPKEEPIRNNPGLSNRNIQVQGFEFKKNEKVKKKM